MKATPVHTALERLRRLPTWAKVAGLLTFFYLAAFEVPRLWDTLREISWGLQKASGQGPLVLIEVTRFMLALLGLGIWLLSVYLSARGFLITKRRAYAVLLAYFLLCTITAPLACVSNSISRTYWEWQARLTPHEPTAGGQVRPIGAVPVVKRVSLPVGPALLLLAVWYMGRSEGTPMQIRPSSTTGAPPNVDQ